MTDLLALIAAALAGGAILLIVIGTLGGGRQTAVARLEQYGSSRNYGAQTGAPVRGQRASFGQLITQSATLNALNRVVERRTWSENIARELARADVTLKPIEYLALRVLVIVAAIGIAVLLGMTILPALSNPLIVIAAAGAGYVLPGIYLGRRKARRLNAFNKGLPDTITLISNALRSGSSFLQAIDLVVRETQPPVSTEFNRVIREVNLGLSLETALANLTRRVRSNDLELMTTAIGIQHQVGGNLAEILDTIAFTIRERVRIQGEIRTLTAQQRMSGYVVGFLPIALIVVVSIIAPQFMSAMFEQPPSFLGIPLGVVLLAIGGFFMAIGFMLIRRIVDIEI